LAADGLFAPRLPHPRPEPDLPAHDRLEEGVTSPSCPGWLPCAAGAVRENGSRSILKLMHVSINADGWVHRSGQRVRRKRPAFAAANITTTNSPKHAPKRAITVAPLQTKTVTKSIGWGTWIRTKIDGVRVRSSTVELSPNGRLKPHRRALAWRVNSEAGRAAQAARSSRLRAQTCSTATTPGAALSAPAIAALTE
jgi:hypothetical protein